MIEFFLIYIRGLWSLDLNSGCPVTVVILENVQGKKMLKYLEDDITSIYENHGLCIACSWLTVKYCAFGKCTKIYLLRGRNVAIGISKEVCGVNVVRIVTYCNK
jgi:hypothetical protein